MAKVGDVIDHRGQRYQAVGVVEHRRLDGEMTLLLRWLSACPQCGDQFSFNAPARAARFKPNRRCGKHKRPGVSPRPRHDQNQGGAHG